MAQPFSFGFDSEDLDDSVEAEVFANAENLPAKLMEQGSPLSEPQLHTLVEMVRRDLERALLFIMLSTSSLLC